MMQTPAASADAPAEAPRRSGHLDAGDGARLYWEEWGDPDGVPALYLHGGPGGGLGKGGYRKRFDLARTRVIGLDQRGCGRSTPHTGDPATSLDGHDMERYLGDLEALREHLGVDRWLVSGASWGSTLGLAYAQAHPHRVLGVALASVTTTSRREVDWITDGVGAVFPEAWDRLASHAERAGLGYRRGEGRLVAAYEQLLEADDPAVQDEASREWALWEDTHISIGAGGFRRDPRWDDDRFRLGMCRQTVRAWARDGYCDPPILARMERLAGIPAVLIHGRRDISGPLITAWDLHRAWPGSELVVIEGDGHGGAEMTRAWRAASDALLGR